MPSLVDHLPDLYKHFLPSIFTREIPAETRSTCNNCPMCSTSLEQAKGVPSETGYLFDPKTKCCTFYPDLPNYLVGGLLEDTSEALAEGRRRVREKIAAGVGITPFSMRPPADYDSSFHAAPGSFGRAASFTCPYYKSEGGACTIWRHREAVCSTWFCKYAKGVDGKTFWDTTKQFLVVIQAKLQWYAILKVAPSLVNASIEAATAPRPETLEHTRLWADWQGREEEFYRRTHEEVARLTPREFDSIAGIDGALELHMVEKSYAQLTAALPDHLSLNPALKIVPRGNELVLQTHTKFDTVVVSRSVFEMIKGFDGILSNAEVRARSLEEKGAAIDEPFLDFLYHQRILVGATSRPSGDIEKTKAAEDSDLLAPLNPIS